MEKNGVPDGEPIKAKESTYLAQEALATPWSPGGINGDESVT